MFSRFHNQKAKNIVKNAYKTYLFCCCFTIKLVWWWHFFCMTVLNVEVKSRLMSRWHFFLWPLVCATDLFEIKWTKYNLFNSIPNTVWISCAVFEFLEVWQQGCDCSLGDICIGQWGSKYGGGWGGRLLFSFNISSEPISKSSSAWIQLSSANYPH